MDNFIIFLKEYGVYLVSAILLIGEVLLMILKKRPLTLDSFQDALNQCLTQLPELIKYVEVPGNGVAKKNRVIDACLDFVSTLIGRSLSDIEKRFIINNVDSQIELILSTPKKKEVL